MLSKRGHQFKFIIFLIFFISGWISADHSTNNQTIKLISEFNPPFSYTDSNGKYTGSSIKQLTKIMEKAGIAVEFAHYPWKRALATIKDGQALIYPLTRTKEREDSFKWIFPIHQMNFKLFGLKSKTDANQKDFKTDMKRFICVDSTILCTALESFGIPDEQVIRISTIDDKQMIEMVVRERIDYVLITETGLNYHLELMNLDRELFISNKHYTYPVIDYLAGSTNFDTVLIEKIQKVVSEESKLKQY